jgi:tripartite-type tricarboxylate transporter receptor subunit TctC
LDPIAIMAGSGYAITIPTSVPATTLQEFVAYAKANPNKLNQGLAGGFLPEGEEVKEMLGVKIENVMYRGGAPLTTAIAAGEVQLMFAGVFQGIALRQSGKARMIAYTGLERHPALPDVPTLAESGFPRYATGFWLGLFGPAGLPPGLIEMLNREIREMDKAPETLDRYKALGYEAYDYSPEQVRQELRSLNERATVIVQRLGIKPE